MSLFNVKCLSRQAIMKVVLVLIGWKEITSFSIEEIVLNDRVPFITPEPMK